MRNKTELTLVIIVLLVLGLGTTYYKVKVLGFSFRPDKLETVWTVESAIDFVAEGGPVKVTLNMPDNSADLVVTDFQVESPGYNFQVVKTEAGKRGVWTSKKKVSGPQRLYFRASIYRRGQAAPPSKKAPALPKISQPLSGLNLEAARQLVKKARSKTPAATAAKIIELLNSPEENAEAALLLKVKRDSGGRLGLARDLLTMAGIPSRIIKGLLLEKNNRLKKLTSYLEIYADGKWEVLNPRTAKLENPRHFLLWQRGGESLLEVEGGSDSRVRFSSLATKILANKAAIKAGKHKHSWLIDFSIYSLPLYSQNT
ncbi:MAG: UUP1 family membrane protein, partial [Deltaproteobacteria bacterium]|nr:UUP1 family membrane protein [Deltaproteobacteria bacterium]